MLLDPAGFDLVLRRRGAARRGGRGRAGRPAEAGADAVRARVRHRRLRRHRPRPRPTCDLIRQYVADQRARARDMRLGAAGTHPFSLFENQKITARDRYRALVEMLQYVARRELVFGMHVHVAVPDARGLPGGDGGRPDRAAGAARALGQLAVLARRAHRPRVDPGDDLRRVPAQRPAAAVRRLPGLRRGGRVHGGHRRDRRLHAPVVGRAPAPALRHARAARDGLPDAGRGRDRAGGLRAVPGEAPARPLRGRRGTCSRTTACCCPRTSGSRCATASTPRSWTWRPASA